MPRFAANLTFLFGEMPMEDRFQAAADAGFTGVEILYPYDIAADVLMRRAKDAGVEIVLINTPPANWSDGPCGFAAIPGREKLFRDNFERTLHVADSLQNPQIHVIAGPTDHPDARAVFVENLAWAIKRAPDTELNIEVINAIDRPNYFLANYDLAAGIISEINAPNLALQFDVYHAHLITGQPLEIWKKYAEIIRHIQIGGVPNRHEPIDGEFSFTSFFEELDQSGYRGWVSAEYNPANLTEDGLGWLPRR